MKNYWLNSDYGEWSAPVDTWAGSTGIYSTASLSYHTT